MRDHSKHIELSRDEAVYAMLDALDDDFGWRCPFSEASRTDSCVNKAAQKLKLDARDNVWTQEARKREIKRKLCEMVPLSQALGRVLAHSVHARVDVPNVLTCCMDSVALHWSDFKDGMPDTSLWVRGKQWEFANTGIAMPQGFDTAVVVENVDISPDSEHITIKCAPSQQFAGTRPKAAIMKQGDLLVAAGSILTPDDIARIASGNHSCVAVVKKPRVAFIPTGNELVVAGSPFVQEGKNLESNSYVVQAKVEQWGGVFVPFDIVRDIPKDITEAIYKASEVADIVVLNAGSSKGSDDWSVEQLETIGQIICHETNHGPGHHSSYAIVEHTPIVGISGPAGGASFTLNFYLQPLIRRFLGLNPYPQKLKAVLTQTFPQKTQQKHKPLAGEDRPSVTKDKLRPFYGIKFVYAELKDDARFYATPVPGRPGSTESLHANAYYMMPSGSATQAPKAGDIIEIELR